MPLLANKLYVLNKTKKDKKEDDQILCHPLTNEICDNAEELARKTFLYNQKIWTCRITGQINLTFKEAQKSEQGCAKMLKNSFMKCYEPTVLQYVHHNRDSLESIIHKSWTQIHEEFSVNEPVTIKLTTPKQLLLKGVVVKIDRTPKVPEAEADSSPNKINSESSNSDKENVKKKTIPVKKSYHYSVKLFDMDKLVNDIPAATIERTLRPPSKDQIRMFIRAHSIRHFGKPVNPWVVEEDLVKKYKLPNTDPDFIFDKAKIKEMSHNAEMQMYSKLKEENQKKENDSTVDLTKSDDEDSKKPRRSIDSAASKKMKQMTLPDMRSSTPGTATRPSQKIKSPFSSPTRSMPPIAQQLLRLMKEEKRDHIVNQLILKCCRYTDSQIEKFPELIREPIKEKKEKLEYKKKLKNMTPEEREAFLTERRQKLREEKSDKKKEIGKVEDEEADNDTAVVEGRPITVQGSMTHDQWARLVSMSEFVRCFKGLLGPARPDQDGDLSVEEVCRAAIGDRDHDRAIYAELVCLLLKPLLQDSKLRQRKELGVSLGEFPVTACTASELVRLILPMEEEGTAAADDEEAAEDAETAAMTTTRETSAHNNLLAGPICERLLSMEMHQLPLEDKIVVLELLQGRILELELLGHFIEDCQREATEAYKRRQTDIKELNDRLRATRASMAELYKLKTAVAAAVVTVDAGEEALPLAARRRLSLELKNKENEEREREREYQRLEQDEVVCKRSIEQAHSAYGAAIGEARQLMRVQPLGTDRANRRYWMFRTMTAANAVFVETEEENGLTTWAVHDSSAMIEALVASLNERGVRESLLKKELQAVLAKLAADPNTATEETAEAAPEEEEPQSFLVRGFKDELKETEMNVRQGSLGGVEDFEDFELSLVDATDLPRMKEALVAVFLGVHDRFWSGVLKTSSGREDFLSEVEAAGTQGRLNLLQVFLDVCVCWSKAASDDKCRVCHKSSNEARMLLCDGCNRAYHVFCLRPPLADVPDGEWLCPRCRPRRGAAVAKETVVVEEEEEVCCVCHGLCEDGLGKCSVCERCYHAQCHEPPLRHLYRSKWVCATCRTTVKETRYQEKEEEEEEDKTPAKKRKNRSNGFKKTKNNNCEEEDDDEEEKISAKKRKRSNGLRKRKEEEEDNRSEEEEEEADKRLRKASGARTKRPVAVDSDEEEEEPEAVDRRRAKKTNGARSKKQLMIESDEEEAEPEVVVAKPTRSMRKRLADSNDDDSAGNESDTPKKSTLARKNAIKRRKTIDNDGVAIKTLLRQLTTHKCSWPFREAVDREEVPDYYQIVTRPIDLGTMSEKLRAGEYGARGGLTAFLGDVGLMFENADLYNEAGSEVMEMAGELQAFFVAACRKSGLAVHYEPRIGQ